MYRQGEKYRFSDASEFIKRKTQETINAILRYKKKVYMYVIYMHLEYAENGKEKLLNNM